MNFFQMNDYSFTLQLYLIKKAQYNQNKFMSEKVIGIESESCLNPQQGCKQKQKSDQLSMYKLNQSFFTKQQLRNQPQFRILKYEYKVDSVEPVLHASSNTHNVMYMGGTHMGLYHGWGVLITKSTIFQGRFSLGHKMGKGFMKFPNGSIFIGDFTNDKPHGQGMMELANQYYIGDFQNGAMQGDGLWKNNKHQKYVGHWKNNRAHGHGIYATDKSHYQGQFVNFLKHGYGIQNFPNGDIFRGYYFQGKPHGIGEYHWANGASYKGEFLNGFRQGQGTWISENGDKYIGHFSNDRKNGPGQYFWANGNTYKGNFSQDMREGDGQMHWNDGSVYTGQWQRGLPHGKGIFKVNGQKPRVGFFEDNVLVNQQKQKQFKHNQPISHHHRDSLILAMIPQVSKRYRKRKIMNSQKKTTKIPISTSSTMSFMGTTKIRGWRSRNK